MPLKQTESPPPRFGWLDTLKGISILAVVIGHIATPLSPFIYLWHIPLFFFLAGLTLKPDKPMISFLQRQAKTLLLPYFGFGVIGIGAELLKRQLLPSFEYVNQSLSIWQYLRGLAVGMNIESLPHYGFVLWFLIALFWAKLLALLLTKVSANRLKFLAALLCLLLGFSFPNLPFGLSTGLIGTFWLMLGFLSNQYVLETKYSSMLSKVFFGTMFTLTLVASQFVTMNIAYRQMSSLFFGLVLSSLFALSLVMVVKMVFPDGLRGVNWLGRNSLALLIIHPYLNNFGYIFTTLLLNLHWIIDIVVALLLNFTALFTLQFGMQYVKKSRKKN